MTFVARQRLGKFSIPLLTTALGAKCLHNAYGVLKSDTISYKLIVNPSIVDLQNISKL